MYSKFNTGNYGTAGKRGHWPASEDISLPYLTYVAFLSPEALKGDCVFKNCII